MTEHLTDLSPTELEYDDVPPSIPCGQTRVNTCDDQGPGCSGIADDGQRLRVYLEPEPDPNDITVTDDFEYDVLEYNRLLQLADDLPSKVFIDQLLLDYDNTPEKLEYTRSMLFSTVRDSNDFDLESGCELKRRVANRNGNPLNVKLANDIHSLILVLKGEGLTYLKDIISYPEKGPRNSASQTPAKGVITPLRNNDKCTCCQEMPMIRDMISSLQADMLHMKQKGAANQRQRDGEIDSMRDAVITAQKDIDTVRNDCVWFRTHDSNNVAKSELQAIKEHVKTLDMSLITIQEN